VYRLIDFDGNAWARSYDGRRALFDRADHRNHIGALETQSLGLAIKGVADVEERRRDPGLARRHGDQAEAVKRQERERIPLGRRGHPNDVSRWIISLADPAADWITQVLAVDGGLGLV
jgi:NAD(P)-dependent dehydrogenase (short-subunit alcohol dehydrogenase family)